MAESILRSLAETYTNAYLIGIFACCRQLYNEKNMEGQGITKDQAEIELVDRY